MNGIINLYKPIGQTPFMTIEHYRNILGKGDAVKMGYAGRLDPLASGVLLVMLGDLCKQRERFQDLSKNYDFKVLLGISTDSLDPLGVITGSDLSSNTFSTERIAQIESSLTGKYDQRIPLYSSFIVNGIKMHEGARKGVISEMDRPRKEVEIFDLKIKKYYQMNSNELISQFITYVRSVKGNFRQDETILSWENEMRNDRNDFTLLECSASVGSGTYVRSIAESIGEALETKAIAYDIVRTMVGEYSISNSLKLWN